MNIEDDPLTIKARNEMRAILKDRGLDWTVENVIAVLRETVAESPDLTIDPSDQTIRRVS